jgi:Carboxypeptidase regulatory-like domain
MKPRRLFSSLLVSLAVVLAIATPARAQKITGDITGTVNDASGAALPGAAVTATCAATGLVRTAVAASTGVYSLPELPICVYKVSAAMQGFKTTSREVQVAVSNVTKADFKLAVGQMEEEVTVEGVVPVIEFSDKLNN